MKRTFKKILIANRGEIAVRIVRSCRELGIETVIVHSTADRGSYAVKCADEAVEIGPAEPSKSYLDIEKVLEACRRTGAEAVHPGYGFLSENATFARRLADAGIIFIGPSPAAMQRMGDKIAAREVMIKSGVPVVPGYNGAQQDEKILLREAEKIGFPVLIKAAAGGGGRGMRLVEQKSEFLDAARSARREAKGAFGADALFIEKYMENPRHIEIQIFGDSQGNVVHLFERDCSIQRRRQKVVEESPGPTITDEIRQKMAATAVTAAQAVNYEGAGTVEFIYSEHENRFYFLEMNTRLQVEHPVTEMITGIDLVREQIYVASGHPLSFRQEDIQKTGHAIEVRLYAEDPANNFMPATGRVFRFIPPVLDGVRVDAGVETGSEVSIYYDPMIAKIIAHASDRETALDLLETALAQTVFFGPQNNLDFLRAILGHADFRAGRFSTDFLELHFAGYAGGEAAVKSDPARVAVGLLHYHGGKWIRNLKCEERSKSVPAPWRELQNFSI